MPKSFISNPNGSRVVANEKVGMGNAQNVYFREDVAKPSQVLVAAADPDTLQRIAVVKQALMQRTMNGVWRALGVAVAGLALGAILAHFGVVIPELVSFLIFLLTTVAVFVYAYAITGRIWIVVVGTGLGVLIVVTIGKQYPAVFQSFAFAVVFLVAGAPLYAPLIHGARHANKYSAPMTNLLYTLEDRFKVDVTGDGLVGDPIKAQTQQEPQAVKHDDIEININGEPVAHEPAIPHVVTRQVLIAPFNTERQTGLYTPAQALDFYILVSKEPRYMDRNNIYGHGLQVGSPPWRIDLSKNSHDDLKAGLFALGAIVRVSGKYRVSGKTKREVATLLEAACKPITMEF